MQNLKEAISFLSREVESSRLFFLDPVEDEDFAVVFGGYERCASDYQIDRCDFPWFSLEFVSHGSGKIQIAGVDEILQPGHFYTYGPSLPHRIESSANQPLGKYFVGFTGRDVAGFLAEFGMEPGTISRCLKGEPIRRVFDTLIERGKKKSRMARPLCVALTKQLLLMCRDDATGPVCIDTPAFQTYSRAKDFIEQNYLGTTTLDAIAKACETDGPYLCRLFARFHDESPYQFLTRLRMEYASRILLESDVSVKLVSETLGFKDAFHFSRVFKSVHHVPPSRFRQLVHQR